MDDFGTVVNASTSVREGTVGFRSETQAGVVASGDPSRVFVASRSSSDSQIASYDLDSLEFINQIRIAVPDAQSGEDMQTQELIRWGDDGLAVSVAGRVLLIDGTFVTPAR